MKLQFDGNEKKEEKRKDEKIPCKEEIRSRMKANGEMIDRVLES
jgi:hypothetical protein